ncbi:hypothetical protein ACFC96_12890 [Streptomyces sp. NPDC055955]|uniref:hypothetical protein n=1 Tax=Streptomyces sp. NPDC055955 TaxID=3345665 RepID=UPI0035DFA442
MPTTTILRLLRHLARDSERTHSAAVNELMDYIPTAVAVGYLREPDLDLPMPGPRFADDISALLAVRGPGLLFALSAGSTAQRHCGES